MIGMLASQWQTRPSALLNDFPAFVLDIQTLPAMAEWERYERDLQAWSLDLRKLAAALNR